MRIWKPALLVLLPVVLLLAVAPGCGPDEPDADEGAGLAAASRSGDLPRWLLERPYLQNLSLWGQDIDMADPPLVRKLGCMGVGNGRVFGILGNQFPLATWHNLGGPTYQTSFKWFSDKEPWLIAGGRKQRPLRQSIHRVRNTPVVIARARNDLLEWTSVNFAPVFPADTRAEHALVSVWIVRNVGRAPAIGVQLEIDSNFGRFTDGALRESDWEGRYLDIRPIEVEAFSGEESDDARIPVGDLAPGQETAVTLVYVFTQAGQDALEFFMAAAEAGVDALLESTVAAWEGWASRIAQVRTPDPKFNDLMRGHAVAIKINQAVSGGVSEMSQYSHTWLRDTHGPSLYYPAVGLVEDYRDMVDYLWGAALIEGRLANAYNVDYDLSDLPPQPDWENLGEMSGRQRAEGPSLLVLEYENLYRATGDLSPVAERYGMLRHALLDQQFVDGCLQHFSSDETFEDLMEIVFGENFLAEPDESTLSLYSSLLMIRAAGFMAEAASLLGFDDDAAMFEELADSVLDCLEQTFWMEEHGRYAVKADTQTREPFWQPYEDVSTMPLWLQALPADSPRVISNFERTLSLLGRPGGTIGSPMGHPYDEIFFFIKEGVQTGMSHGYWLSNLDRMFHPLADEAFRRWCEVHSAAGFTDEAVIVDDYGHLGILREPWGFVCDVSNRFRSWESGVMGYALLYHLTGYDVRLPEYRVRLAPHLPPEWDRTAFYGLACGQGRFDLEVSSTDGPGRLIEIAADATVGFDLELTVPLDGEVVSASLDGEELPASAYAVEINRYGRTIVTFDPVAIPPGGSAAFAVSATR